MARLYNLARMTSTTAGSGTVTLGAAVPPYLTFALAGVSNGQTVAYGIRDGTANSEVGTGVYSSGTLTRNPTDSTNGGAAISLSGSSSSVEVFITARYQDIANLNEANTFSALNTFGSTTTNGEPVNIVGTDHSSQVGPIFPIDRLSSSPATGDILGQLLFGGNNSTAAYQEYASIYTMIDDVTAGSEDGRIVIRTVVAGTEADRFSIGAGLYASSMTDPGAGNANFNAILGFSSNSLATTGYIGEVVETVVSSAGAIGLTTATAKAFAGMTLSAGDWEVSGNIIISCTSSRATVYQGSVSATSNAIDGTYKARLESSGSIAAAQWGQVMPSKSVQTTGTQYYGVGFCTFASGTTTMWGTIRGRRVR